MHFLTLISPALDIKPRLNYFLLFFANVCVCSSFMVDIDLSLNKLPFNLAPLLPN